MSTKKERDQITAMGVDAWHDVDKILSERGERWPHTDTMTWGPGLHGAMHEANVYAKVLGVLGCSQALDLIIHRHDQDCARCETAATG
ncbi:hypothetical protein CDO52_00645 [Nocardiopsis gilva YIM 90087]|uniref:Uncharacterized protein n=1 Tax=Nocardiopsis gilva YIM 90087 TaxID=1235441 RepID=A0A223S068_9ACTN|nr:hypothetical protein [Nocardiopsis gilva]ASU81487.1 hypothetical protein CDO52_00645 [Nocardiopsis gilva YIM 90087]